MTPTLDLDLRPGLPPDLRVLLDRYPREVWPEHANLGETARMWLGRHDMFRDFGGVLSQALADHREGRIEIAAFRHWFAPRLRFFLQNLEGHHQVEDHQYFPRFLSADRRLARGFDLLESDHEVIHADLVATAETATLLLSAASASQGKAQDGLRRAADAYAEASERLLRRLMRHLEDEEDLIIPLILDRGEPALGIG